MVISSCPFLQNCFTIDLTTLIGFGALILSLITAYVQIKIQTQELRPYLSFTGTQGIVRINEDTKMAGVDFYLMLENAGKSVLRYEVIKFDIFMNGAKINEVDVKSKGTIVGVNAKATYHKFYNGIIQYDKDIDLDKCIPPNYKIIFEIDYYKIKNSNKRYKLKYEVFVEYDQGMVREIYGETFAN